MLTQTLIAVATSTWVPVLSSVTTSRRWKLIVDTFADVFGIAPI